MSQLLGRENRDSDTEENPEPEEDADWCQTEDVGNPGVLDLPVDQQGEEPEAISEFDGAVSFGDETENERRLSEEACTNRALLDVQHGEEEDCLVEDDGTEQDEQMAAPESDNEVIQQACSESDQQMQGLQLSSSITGDNVTQDVLDTLSTSDINNEPMNIDCVLIAASNENYEDEESEGCESLPQVFSGDVRVDGWAGVDAPEDDHAINHLHCHLSAEESAALPESGRVSLSKDSLGVESSRNSDTPPERDRDSQVPECDRNEGVNRRHSSQSGEDQRIPNSLSGDLHLESVQDREADLATQNKETESSGDGNGGGDGDIMTTATASIPLSLTSESHCYSTEEQSVQLPWKVSNVEHRDDTSQEMDKSSSHPSSSSPSHPPSQFQHSSESASSNHPSNKTDGVVPDTISSPPPLASYLSTTQPDNDSQDSVSPTPNGSLHRSNTLTDTVLRTDLSLPVEVGKSVEDIHTGRQSSNSFHQNSHHPVSGLGVGEPSNQSNDTTKLSSPDIQKQLLLALSKEEDDDLDDIMSELDAELLSRSSKHSAAEHFSLQQVTSLPRQSPLGDCVKGRPVANGVIEADVKLLQDHNRQLLEQLKIRDAEISKLSTERDSYKTDLTKRQCELDEMSAKSSSQHNRDDLYLPQIKELENTIVQQQKELQASKDKLISHDTAAKRAVTTLQNELKNRVDQVTKLYEDAVKEKDSMVVMFAASESKVMESKRAAEKLESRMRDAGRERESMISTLKAAKIDKQKAINSYEQKCSEFGNLQRELEKLKEGLSSSDYRIKWFQNKLKEELEAHKETKSNLEKTTSKLKETKEETEIIRKECQAIVKTYQESEEIKSNSLDKELKMKESQFKLHMQEWSDTEEIHQRTKKELDNLKQDHKEALAQVCALKEKVESLETAETEKESVIFQSNEMLNKQKADITDMSTKLKEKQNLDEDFTRAQEMIKTLDKDISELKISNRDLQKDMDSCRERESKMLALQSELSRTNACLRSENTTLSNRVTNQTAEVERLKMEIQEMETSVKHLTDSIEEEKKSNAAIVTKLKASLEEKTKESCDFKQKWEDEIDSNKTLKRRHANNIKDLSRQLHQTKRRLETLEGSRKDSGESMGSRTNSNGSLNSIDNSQTGVASGGHHMHSGTSAAHPTSPQDFPVITEQVEIDKQVLIERIVRLQKSHARKNEKLEFLGEHIQQLLEEIKKKNKIIQSYVMREEAGTLSSDVMDANKSLLSRKGGIMASVYTLHQQDGAMTLELSLQINKKLQAVLEDTLLKNITLKENLDTLGEEIARLSQVNRKLQLHLQDLENPRKM